MCVCVHACIKYQSDLRRVRSLPAGFAIRSTHWVKTAFPSAHVLVSLRAPAVSTRL